MSEIVQLLKKLCGYDVTMPIPSCRFTNLLYKIHDPSYVLYFDSPQSRIENYLFDIINNTVLMKDQNPQSNIELLLACKLGYIEIVPTLVMSEIDYYLDEWVHGNVYDYNNPYDEKIIPLSQPITLCGLPVTSGGNVTIDGKQYRSDSIEMMNGEIKHINRLQGDVINSSNVTYCRVMDNYRGMDLLTSEFRYDKKIDQYIKNPKCVSNSFKYDAIWSKDIEGCSAVEENIDFTVLKSRVGITNDMSVIDRQSAFYNYVKNNDIEFKFLSILKNEVIEPLPLKIKAAMPQYTRYNIKVNDDKEYRIKHAKVFGQSYQETTTGAQLLDFRNGTNVKNVTENSFDIVATNDKDRICVFKHNLVVGEKYVLSYSKTPGVALGAYVRYAAGGYLYFGSDQVFTIEKEVAEFAIYIAGEHIGKTSTITNPMLNKGTVPLPFEQYTNGVASPSPDYPQEIISKVVNEIKVNNGGYLMKGTYNTNVQKIALKKDVTYYVNYGGVTADIQMNMYVLAEDKIFSTSGDLYNYCYNSGIRVINNSGMIDNPCKLPAQLNLKYKFTAKNDGMFLYQAVNADKLNNDNFRLFYADGGV